MPSALKITYEWAEGLRVRQAREGFILLSPLDGMLHTLNSSAAFIFELCDGLRGPQEIADALREKFDLPKSPLGDVLNCLEGLVQKGLLTRSDRNAKLEQIVNRRPGGQESGSDTGNMQESDGLLERLYARLHISASPILCERSEDIHYIPQRFAYPIFNPSVIATSSSFIFLTRCTNEHVLADGNYIIKHGTHNTFNVLHYYDFELKFIRSQVVDDTIMRRNCRAAELGFEDGRIFLWKGSNWVLATGRSRNEGPTVPYSPVLVRLNRNKIVECVSLKSPKALKIEKNWIPFVRENRLYIIYSILPLVVYAVDEDFTLRPFAGKLNEVNGSSLQLRGGSQFIPWNGGYLGVAHDPPVELTSKLYYSHRFVALDEKFRVREISEPFFIQRKGIEFVCGIAAVKGRIVLSYGVADRAAAFVELSKQTLSRWLLTTSCPLGDDT